MALPTALRVRVRASSSISRSRPPTLSLRVRKPSSTAFVARTSVSAGVGLSDYGVDFNGSGRAAKEDGEGLGLGLGKAVQCCGLKGEGESGWRNGGKWCGGEGPRQQGRGDSLEGGSEVSEGCGTAGERGGGFAEADDAVVGLDLDQQAKSVVDGRR